MASNNDIVSGFDDEKDESLKISLERVESNPSALTIRLMGYVDTYNSNFFQKRIQKVVNAGFANLIFNCSGLNYVSSTGIGSFTSFLKLVQERSGSIVLVSIQPKVFEVFQLLGFSQFFNIKNSMEDAINFFSQSNSCVSSVFPKVFSCPMCSKKLKVPKAGRFRCSECKMVLSVNSMGDVSLG